MTIFDFFKQVTTDKKPWLSFTEDEQKAFNPYMLHKIVSMTEAYIEVANMGQSLPYTDK